MTQNQMSLRVARTTNPFYMIVEMEIDSDILVAICLDMETNVCSRATTSSDIHTMKLHWQPIEIYVKTFQFCLDYGL